MKLTLTLAALLGAALALPTGMPPRPIETDDPLQELPEFQAVDDTGMNRVHHGGETIPVPDWLLRDCGPFDRLDVNATAGGKQPPDCLLLYADYCCNEGPSGHTFTTSGVNVCENVDFTTCPAQKPAMSKPQNRPQDLHDVQAVNGTNDSTVTTDPVGDVDFPHPKPEIMCKGDLPYCGSRYDYWDFWGGKTSGIAPRGDGHHDKQDQTWGSAIRDLWRFVWKRDEGAVAPRGGGHHDKQDQSLGSAIKDLWQFIWKRDEGEEDAGTCDEGEADPVEEWSKLVRDPQDEESDRAVVTPRDVAVRDDDGENPCEKTIKPADVFFVFDAYDKGLKCAQWRKEQEEKWQNN